MNDTQKLVAGALLVGTSLLTGNAALITSAGGVGVNWPSEALAGLLDARKLALDDGEPLAAAYRDAIKQALDDLRTQYRKLDGRSGTLLAFDLVESCSRSVAQAQFPATLEVAAVQQALAASLDQLLLDHDERQVAFLQTHLQAAVARRFRTVLAADANAWRRYHGWLIEQMAAALTRAIVGSTPASPATDPGQAAAGPSKTELMKALAAFDDAAAMQARLETSTARLEELIAEWQAGAAQQPRPTSLTFDNRDMQAGTVVQGQNVNHQSAVSKQGGTSTVYNISGAVLTPEVLAALLRIRSEPAASEKPQAQDNTPEPVTPGDPNAGPHTAPGTATSTAGLPHKLTGGQMRALHAALLDAFTPATLERMLAFHLNTRLIDVAGGPDFSAVVFNLIDWAQRSGQLPHLLEAARHDAPANPQLNAVLRSLQAV